MVKHVPMGKSCIMAKYLAPCIDPKKDFLSISTDPLGAGKIVLYAEIKLKCIKHSDAWYNTSLWENLMG